MRPEGFPQVLSEAIDTFAPTLENFLGPAPTPVVEPQSAAGSRARLGPDFARLWAATAASNLSDGIRQAALPLIAASLTRDPAQVAGVMFAAQAPWLLFGLASGAIVDRLDRRRIIGAAHLVRMTAVILLAVAVGTGTASIAMLFGVAFVLGIAETLFDNATQVMTAELVDESQLERANGRLTMAVVGGQQLVGPLLGAALFASFVSAPLFIDGLVLCAAALLVFSIAPTASASPALPDAPGTGMVRDSLRWLLRHRTLRAISIGAALVNIAVVAHLAVFVLFTQEVLGLGEFGYVAMIFCYAVGGLAGGALAPRIVGSLGWRRAVVFALSAATATLLISGATTNPVVVAAMQAVLALAASVWMVATCSLRQRLAPEGMLGRITGAHQLLSWGGAGVGALLGGFLANAWGLAAPFFAGGALLLVVALGLGLLPLDDETAPQPA
jgi:MFS family permease